jgi:phage recombination protein Bet
MSNEITTTQNRAIVNQPPKASALAIMAGRLSVEPTKLLDTLKATVFKGASNEEMLALVAVSNRYGLDPLTKQIYAFPSKGGIQPVVSVDGWLHILNSQPEFDGMEFEMEDEADGKPYSITAVIYRKDRSRPMRVTEYYSECYRPTEPWKQFPRRMLRHKVIKESVRVAFGISGITDEDEARDTIVTLEKNVVIEKREAPRLPKFTVPTEAPAKKQTAPEPAPALELESEFMVDEPSTHDDLRIRIKEHDVTETQFLQALKKISPRIKADQISDLSEEAASSALNELNEILAVVK